MVIERCSHLALGEGLPTARHDKLAELPTALLIDWLNDAIRAGAEKLKYVFILWNVFLWLFSTKIFEICVESALLKHLILRHSNKKRKNKIVVFENTSHKYG